MKILFLSEAVSLAHIGRPLILAQWAYKNGHEVHFAASASGLEKTNAKSNQFATYTLPTIEGSLFYHRIDQGKFFYTKIELKNYIEDECRLISKIKPNLIVSDFRLTSAISAELTNKHLLSLSNAYWSPNYSCPFPAPNVGLFKLLSQRSTDFIFNMMRPMAFKMFGKELNQIRAFYGLEKKSDFRELYTAGNYAAYMDMPDFVNINKLPENHFFLGPVVWSPEMPNENLELNDKNFVYISMGSTGENSLLPLIIRSIIKRGFKVILSGVNAEEKEALYIKLPELKNKSIIQPLIQAEKILSNCKLSICHGGSGTVYQSLSHGTPVVCFPRNPDQSLVSVALVEKNLGRYLSSKNATLKNIDIMLNECLSNEIIKQNAVNYAKKIQLWNTENRWNQFLNQFKTARKTIKVIA